MRMRHRAIGIVVFVGLLASFATPTGVAADSRFRGHGATTFGGRHRAPAIDGHRFNHHRGFRHHLGGLGVVIATPIVVYTPPVFAAPITAYMPPYAPPVIYSAPPPVVSAPPVVYSAPPTLAGRPPAPLPRVVEHPHGRYELRGDGVSTPYTWVWIPNHPPPPPPTPPPAATPNGAPTSGGALPAREHVYQWVDEQGVGNWTNRVDRVPRRYREQASQ